MKMSRFMMEVSSTSKDCESSAIVVVMIACAWYYAQLLRLGKISSRECCVSELYHKLVS